MLVFKFFLVKHYFNGVIFAPLFLLSPLNFIRRQELRELRFLQKEEQRAQQQLNGKLQQQREQIFRRERDLGGQGDRCELFLSLRRLRRRTDAPAEPGRHAGHYLRAARGGLSFREAVVCRLLHQPAGRRLPHPGVNSKPNIACFQTLKILNNESVLQEYKAGYLKYIYIFGNIFVLYKHPFQNPVQKSSIKLVHLKS